MTPTMADKFGPLLQYPLLHMFLCNCPVVEGGYPGGIFLLPREWKGSEWNIFIGIFKMEKKHWVVQLGK